MHNIPFLSLFYTGTARHTMIGHGLCRGPDWQNGQWPHDEGFETLDQCSLECEKRPGCTGIFTLFLEKKYFEKIFMKSFNLGFDMTPNEDFKGKQRCILHGHGDIQVATATSLQDSRCYRMIGKKALPPGTKAPPKATSKAAGTGTPTKASKVKTR